MTALSGVHERGSPFWFSSGSPWSIGLWLFIPKPLLQKVRLGRRLEVRTCVLVLDQLLLLLSMISFHAFQFCKLWVWPILAGCSIMLI